MKKARKLMCVVSAALMLLMPVSYSSASAAGENGKITIVNDESFTHVSISGKTFNAYRIFRLSDNALHNAFDYRTEDAFRDLFKGRADDITSDNSIRSYMMSLDTAAETESFANAAADYINSKGISPTCTVSADGSSQTAEFADLPLGYYLITGSGTNENGETVVSAVMLDSTAYSSSENAYAVTINIKLSVPTCDKEIIDGTGDDCTSANVGDTVDFRVTSSVPDVTGYTSYELTLDDTLSSGLDFDSEKGIVIKIGDTAVENTDGINDRYSFSVNGRNIKAAFDKNWFYRYISDNSIPAGTPITFEYSAVINKDAVTGTTGNKNTAKITYSSNPKTGSVSETIPDNVNVYTYEINIFKFTGEKSGSKKPLSGAVFNLYKDEKKAENLLHFSEDYVFDKESENADIVSDSEGNIVVKGLEAGKYILEETEAPSGYNKLEEPVLLNITEDSESHNENNAYLTASDDDCFTVLSDGENGDKGIKAEIQNLTGQELPGTGGRGIVIFYTAGGILIMAAVIIFTVKKLAANYK